MLSWLRAHGQSAGSDDLVRPYLQPSHCDIHLVVVGVNLIEQLESQMRRLCTLSLIQIRKSLNNSNVHLSFHFTNDWRSGRMKYRKLTGVDVSMKDWDGSNAPERIRNTRAKLVERGSGDDSNEESHVKNFEEEVQRIARILRYRQVWGDAPKRSPEKLCGNAR